MYFGVFSFVSEPVEMQPGPEDLCGGGPAAPVLRRLLPTVKASAHQLQINHPSLFFIGVFIGSITVIYSVVPRRRSKSSESF